MKGRLREMKKAVATLGRGRASVPASPTFSADPRPNGIEFFVKGIVQATYKTNLETPILDIWQSTCWWKSDLCAQDPDHAVSHINTSEITYDNREYFDGI